MSLQLEINKDKWLSKILSRPSFNLHLSDKGCSLTTLMSNELSSSEVFATLKIPTTDLETSAEMQRLGFIHVETSLVFEGLGAKIPPGDCIVRPAVEQDEEAVVKIAETAFSYSRFHLDPYIPNQLANKIKGLWAGNYFRGERGDGMLVAIINNTISGFLQFFINHQSYIVIDLIAVSPEGIGNGFGSQMFAHLINHPTNTGESNKVKVGTQACNTASINFYFAAGLNLVSSQNVFHFHGELAAEKSKAKKTQ